MSQLGQKRKWPRENAMSVLPSSGADIVRQLAMSVSCQFRTLASQKATSLDHLVCRGQQ
jgi:hypothetical protein